MNFVVEYIGAEGVKHTPLSYSGVFSTRLDRPKPGDVVDFRLMKGEYPFTYPFGTVESIGGGMANADEAHVCCQPGSIFLSWNSELKEPTVSISGGPFACVRLTRLKWMSYFQFGGEAEAFRIQRMWNWGNNGSGANHGVDYHIMRPVFVLLP